MELDITRLAHDAGITLPEEYKDDLANDLTSLLEHMKHLLTVDLEGYEPTFSMVESQQLRLFDDVVEQTLSSEVLLRQLLQLTKDILRFLENPRGPDKEGGLEHEIVGNDGQRDIGTCAGAGCLFGSGS